MTDGPHDPAERPGDPDRPDPRVDPFGAIFGAGADPANLGAAFERIGRLLSWQGGPVNWDLAREVARQTITEHGDRSVGDTARRGVEDALRLADHWLDDATSLPAAGVRAVAWSRAEWFEATVPVWQRLIDPVAAHVVDAMSGALPGGTLGSVGETELPAQMLGMMRQVGGAMFGGQVGTALGELAGEVVGASDIGLPLVADGTVALLPANVDAFGEGLGVSGDDVRLYLALREAAYGRLYAHVPWLGPRLIASIEDYGRGIVIDTSRLEEAVRDIDPSRPDALQDVLGAGLFEPTVTPSQQVALDRIETLLALVEGWVDDVVTQATEGRMPAAVSLREAVRRRRAVGGPAEQTFASLVGLELRPRRLRDAATLWGALRAANGAAGRDALWAHPDLIPSARDLDDPLGFVHREPGSGGDFEGLDSSAVDELAAGLAGGSGSSESSESSGSSGSSDTSDTSGAAGRAEDEPE